MLEQLPLVLVVFVAFIVEASLGFGSTVVTVALASLWLPMESVLAAFLPVNLLLSGYLFLKYRAQVAWRFLGLRLLPFMGLGLPFGFLAFTHFEGNGLKSALGVFILVLSLSELLKLWRGQEESRKTLSPAFERLALVVGGIAHGAFASGGPVAVWATSRVVEDKGAFRASLSVLWLVLNLVLVAGYLLKGRIDANSLATGGTLLPALGLGIVVGELAHRRIDLRTFRIVVYTMLLVIGALLVAKG